MLQWRNLTLLWPIYARIDSVLGGIRLDTTIFYEG